jgi:Tol biopolymer transport system component
MRMACVLLCACGRLGFDPIGDAHVPDAWVPLGSFGAPTQVAIPFAGAKTNPSMTADGLELYFVAYEAGPDLYVTTRATPSAPWSTPAAIAELNTTAGETDPEIASDGLEIYFASDRGGSFDIFRAARASRAQPWSVPAMVAELSTADHEFAPAIDSTGRRLVFSSNRPGGAGSTDLYLATRATTTAPWDPPQPLATINTADEEGTPSLGDDGRTLVFLTRRATTADYDLFEATRTGDDAAFAELRAMTELNSEAADSGPWLSADARHILFDSWRTGLAEIYEATR